MRDRESERDRRWEVEVAENSGKQLEYHKVQPWGEKLVRFFETKELCFQTSKKKKKKGEKQRKDREFKWGRGIVMLA